nr:hypothetical protein [Tanacetum cinerariifolium]
MTSFGYRFNPRYAIKECSSCGTLYTKDCICSIGTVEDKILVPKPPKNYARCTRCGYLVDGPNCQGCALLRQELEENLVTYSPDFQNIFEPSNASTNVVNAPRESYVVKQDNGSFVDKIIFDFNRAPDSLDQFHCFHVKDVLRYGEACKRCTCVKCGSGLGKGLCYICGHNQNSLNDSPKMEDLKQQYLDELQRLSNLEYRDEIKIAELKENFNGMSIEIRKKEKLLQEEHTTTHPDLSLPEYEAFHDDHVKEISSGSPTTYFDSSLYASFMFDLSINSFPPADRSDYYEFTDKLIPFISAPEYDCFLFKNKYLAKNVAADAKDGQDADIDESANIQGRTVESQAQIYQTDLELANQVLSIQDEEESEPAELQEVVDVVTTAKIITKVVTAASDTITAASTTITGVGVPILAATTSAAPTLTAAPSRRRKGVVIRGPQETASPSTIIHSKAKSKDKGKEILVEEPKPLKKQAQIKQDEKYAREDLEALWSLVKERFATRKPKNFSDDFLLITLGAMFEKPDIHAQIWKNKRSVHGQAKVKSWKLLESCGV